jgi:hypothetical protein
MRGAALEGSGNRKLLAPVRTGQVRTAGADVRTETASYFCSLASCRHSAVGRSGRSFWAQLVESPTYA